MSEPIVPISARERDERMAWATPSRLSAFTGRAFREDDLMATNRKSPARRLTSGVRLVRVRFFFLALALLSLVLRAGATLYAQAELGKGNVEILIEALSAPNPDVTSRAQTNLVQIGPPSLQPLLDALESKVALRRANAANALGSMRHPRV